MTGHTARRWLALILFGGWLVAPFAIPAPAHADAGINCTNQFWLMLGANTRTICDGPIRPDGSWMRAREFWTPAHYVRGSGYCSRYSCSYSEGYYQERTSKGIEVYPVTADSVLPDEPGHLA